MVLGIDITPILQEINSHSTAFSLEFSKLVYEEVMKSRSIKEMHDIHEGIENGELIPFAKKGKGYKYMKSKEGLDSQCGYNECDFNSTFSTKKWETHKYNCEPKLCIKDLEQDFAKWWGLNCKDLDPENESDVKNAFIDFLVSLNADYLTDSLWTKVWFSALSYGKASDLYGADGLFTQMLAIAPETNKKQRVTIAENGNATFDEQLALDPQRAFEVYSAMYDKALKNKGIRGVKNAVIYTTEDLAINYLQYLRDNNQVNCCFKSDVTKGEYSLDSLNIFGMPIEIVPEWDEIIQGEEDGIPYFSELNDGTKWTNPHRAVLTYRENIPVGTCNSEKFDKVRVLFDVITELTHLRSEYSVGSKVLRDSHFIIAI